MAVNMEMYLSVCTMALITGLACSQSTYTCELIVNPVLDEPDREDISGTITFTQQEYGEEVTIDIAITGFDTSDNDTEHGFHVHQGDDITSNGCNSAGGHFNPENMNHGAPAAAIRHVGDLGNIEEDENGDVTLTLKDSIIDFNGTHNILGRAIVVHAMEDDLGLGGDDESLQTGNAGPRLGCCIIELNTNSAAMSSLRSSVSFILPPAFIAVKLLTNVLF